MTASLSSDDDEALAESRPRLSRRAWVAVGAGLAVLIALASLWGWWMASDPVRWRDVGFAIDSATEATATYDVFLYTDSPVTCHVRALNARFAEVGATTQEVDPSQGRQQRVSTTIVTTERATTAVVHYCEVDG